MTATPLLDRMADGQFSQPSDGWYHIVPQGDFPHPDSGSVQVIDAAALRAMMDRFAEEKANPHFAGLLVDFDHFSYDTGRSSEAAGWIIDLEQRTGGLWGRIRWSDLGRQAIEHGRYRLLSPTWRPSDVERLGSKRIRPVRLDSVGLTNQPNLRGMAPLTNRKWTRERAMIPVTPRAEGFREFAVNPSTKGPMKNIHAALGLPAEASEETALASIAELRNRAVGAEEALAPLKNRNAELEQQNSALLESQVEADLAHFGSRFKPDAREKWRAALLHNRANTLELLDSLPETPQPPAVNGRLIGAPAPIHNRSLAVPPDSACTMPSPREHPFLNRAGELATARGQGIMQAMVELARKEPALYDSYRESLHDRK